MMNWLGTRSRKLMKFNGNKLGMEEVYAYAYGQAAEVEAKGSQSWCSLLFLPTGIARATIYTRS